MGPCFEKGLRQFGRKRLPRGLIAILDHQPTLHGAIHELHAYALGNKTPNRPRRGIVFRVVSEGDRAAFVDKLSHFFGPKNLAAQEGIYSYPVGHFHVMDDALICHASNRHSIETVPGHIAVTMDDFLLIPETVHPRWITEFSFVKQSPRVVYERRYGHAVLVVVEEIRPQAGLMVKTVYKKKQVAGGIRLKDGD